MFVQIPILFILTIVSSVTCLSFNYTQEYLIGEKGQEIISSQIKGVINLKPGESKLNDILMR